MHIRKGLIETSFIVIVIIIPMRTLCLHDAGQKDVLCVLSKVECTVRFIDRLFSPGLSFCKQFVPKTSYEMRPNLIVLFKKPDEQFPRRSGQNFQGFSNMIPKSR